MAPIATIIADVQKILSDLSGAPITTLIADIEKLIADLAGTPQAVAVQALLDHGKTHNGEAAVNWLALIMSIIQIVLPLLKPAA